MGLLKGLNPLLTADLLWVLRAAGHGDVIAVVDCNFPAAEVATKSTSGKLICLPGLDAAAVMGAIGSVLPIDYFVEQPISVMIPDPENVLPPLGRQVHEEGATAFGVSPDTLKGIHRTEFYVHARKCFAVVQTGERKPYANFLITKGVIGPDGKDLKP